jgi:hypothetical protein
MAIACVDLRPGVDAGPFVAALEAGVPADAYDPLDVWIRDRQGSHRVSLYAWRGNPWFAATLARAAAATDAVERAVVGLDQDEYGAEHVVLDGRAGPLCRVQHVYVYPDGEPDPELRPEMSEFPVREGLAAGPDGQVDGPRSWAVVAGLFEVDPDRVIEANRRSELAYEELGSVFSPFVAWWDALGVVYPVELGEPDRTIGGRR